MGELILKYGDEESNRDLVEQIKDVMLEFIHSEEDEQSLRKDAMKMMILSGKGISMNFDNTMGFMDTSLNSGNGFLNLLSLVTESKGTKPGKKIKAKNDKNEGE